MISRVARSPVFWAVSVLCVVWIVHQFLADDAISHPHSNAWHQLSQSSDIDQGWLIKPFFMPHGGSGIALDGGEIPLLTLEVPELSFGRDARHPLHLALLIDWQSEDSHALIRQLSERYRDDATGSLPPLRLSLLPVISSVESREIHERIIQVFLLSAEIETFPALIQSIINRTSTTHPPDIEAFLNHAEPDLLDRLRLMENPVASSIDATLTAAEAQINRNAALLNLTVAPQLTSIHQILTSPPTEDDLMAYLSAAIAYQDAYLSSPRGLMPIAPDFGCHCQDPSHAHQPWKPAIASQFPDHYPPPDLPMPNGDATTHPPDAATPTGPQIQFSRIVHATDQPHPEKTVTHTVAFENTGGEELEIHEILVDADRMTLQHWDRRIPPASRGSFTVQLRQHQPSTSAHSIWVRTNSIAIAHAELGQEVILRIPAASPRGGDGPSH